MEKQIGPEAKLKAELKGGKIALKLVYDGKLVDASVEIASDSDVLLDALLELIPGDSAIEQGAGAILKAALKNLSV